MDIFGSKNNRVYLHSSYMYFKEEENVYVKILPFLKGQKSVFKVVLVS